MRVVVFGPERRVGVLADTRVIDLAHADEAVGGVQGELGEFGSLAGFIDAGDRALDTARRLLDRFGEDDDPRVTAAVDTVDLHAPYPGRRFALAGSNNADHVADAFRNAGQDVTADGVREKARQGLPDGFWVLGDPVGPGGEVLVPQSADGRFDYEGEVAIVLSKGGKRIKADDWLEHVWGVTLVVDWCVRPEEIANSRRPFYGHKIFDTSKSVGPWIAVDEVDVAATQVRTHVNGELRQDFSTSDMIHSYGELLEQVSRDFTMLAGDLLAGGTGPGTAFDSTPARPGGNASLERYLKAGDVVTVSADGLGELLGRVVAE